MSGWRFYLMALPSREWIDKDVQLSDAVVVEADSLPGSISGYLPLAYHNMRRPDGSLLVQEWGCMLIAEQKGYDPLGCIVDGVSIEDGRLKIDAGGFTSYPEGQPWLGPDRAEVDVDPLDMVRVIWDHLQSYPAGNLRVKVDPLQSPHRIGYPEENVSFTTDAGEDVSFDKGPFRLASWATENLGKTLTDLKTETPFAYREHTNWTANKRDVTHRLELGYPKLGKRHHRLHFEIGQNVVVNPGLQEGDYSSELMMYGSGEGRKRMSNSALVTKPTTRLRRATTRTDRSLGSKKRATAAARPILETLSGAYTIESVDVIDHDLAPYEQWTVGDEIRVKGDAGWVQLDTWVRITEISTDCTTGRRNLKVETA